MTHAVRNPVSPGRFITRHATRNNMEELMKLYEKQKKLDDETKLKMATMQVQKVVLYSAESPMPSQM